MSPTTSDHLTKARDCLSAAKRILELPIAEVAAKEGYLAAFHAAHALIFERTGKLAKTHSGLRTMFARIALEEPLLDSAFVRLLAQSYKFKEVADYGVGPTAEISVADAEAVIATAGRFIAAISHILQEA